MTTTPENRRAPEPASRAADAPPAWIFNEGEPAPVRIGPLGWAVAALRLPVLVVVVFGGLLIHLTIRLFERPLFGLRRPVTPFVTQGVCKGALAILGIRLKTQGRPMRRRGAVVANHASWLDIFVMNAPQRIYFVAKDEIANWPGIGWLARATGTIFIRRSARDARAQKLTFEARLRAGHHLCFFPEGTSSDGIRVLPFKPTLFAAFFTEELAGLLSIQPVSVIYVAPKGRDSRFYGWWGDLGFAAHFLRVLAQPRQGRVELVFHPPVPIAEAGNRKTLARLCEAQVRDGLAAQLPEGVMAG